MSESVEQAALRRAAEPRIDWQARANREATAIMDEVGIPSGVSYGRDELLSFLAIAWLQGVNLGSHETLASAERAFDRLRRAL